MCHSYDILNMYVFVKRNINISLLTNLKSELLYGQQARFYFFYSYTIYIQFRIIFYIYIYIYVVINTLHTRT